jgi:hypothetical protein
VDALTPQAVCAYRDTLEHAGRRRNRREDKLSTLRGEPRR